jgi:ABC-type lipoprotein export system ATPase subunit
VAVVTLLRAEDLFRFYHVGDAEIRALKGVSLEVRAGEIVALTGPSGSGKSTLLSCLCGLDEPDGGTVDIDGRRMSRRPEAEKAALRASVLGIMAQRDNLFAHLTVAENVAFALSCRREGAGDGAAAGIAPILRSVGMTERAAAYPAALSGGETARAAIAVVLASGAALIVADEPTAEIDAATERLILDTLADRSGKGQGALIATHSPAVEAIATRILHLRDGVLSAGPASDTADPGFGVAGNAAGPSRSGRQPALPAAGAPLIAAHGLNRVYDAGGDPVHAVEGADLVLHEGARIAVTGPSGSGKSTLLKMLAGIEPPSSGEITWFGGIVPAALRPHRIGVVFQNPSLIPSLSVRENVALPLQLSSDLPPRDHMSADAALGLLSLSDLGDKLPDELSGGQMQRVAFARALVTNPRVILADEPTGQLDRPTGRALMQAVLGALDANGTALLVTTHDPALAGTMETRFHMDHGQLAPGDRAGPADAA